MSRPQATTCAGFQPDPEVNVRAVRQLTHTACCGQYLFLRRGGFRVVQQRLEFPLYRRVHLMEQQEPSVDQAELILDLERGRIG